MQAAEKADVSSGNPGFSLRRQVNVRFLERDYNYMELLKRNEAGFCNESGKLDRNKRMRIMGKWKGKSLRNYS